MSLPMVKPETELPNVKLDQFKVPLKLFEIGRAVTVPVVVNALVPLKFTASLLSVMAPLCALSPSVLPPK